MTQEEAIRQALQLLYEWAGNLCQYAGEDEAFLKDFWDRLCDAPEILQEFSCYYDTRNFLCEAAIEGCTIADILVWQIDHFKAHLDKGEEDMKFNGDKMILYAFDTMLKMKENPEPYLRKMREETGTDYPDKI